MNSTTASKPNFAVWSVRIAGIWLLLGAVAKLFWGTPKDLPQLIHDVTPFEIDLTFKLIIGVELALVCAAFLKPRIAWLPLVALFVFFDFVLTSQLRAGAESCGCFGGSIKVSPYVMLTIDTLVLLALLVSRPWKNLVAYVGARPPVFASTIVASFVLPWLVIELPYWLESRGETTTPHTAAATSTTNAHTPSAVDGASNPAGAAGTAASNPKSTPTTPLAPVGAQKAKPRYVTLKPDKWIGKSVFDIPELTDWTDADKLPIDGKLILWRQGCDHCRDHLKKLAAQDKGDQPIVMLQIRDDLDTTSLVDTMPDGPHVTHIQYPDGLQFIVMTPWDFDVQGGVIKTAVHEDTPH